MVTVSLDMYTIGAIVLIGMGVLVALIYFATYWMDMGNKVPECNVFLAARKGKRPLAVGLVDLSGRIMFFSGIKERPQNPKLKNDDYGLLIDPRLASKMPKSTLEDGTNVLFYGTNFHFPISPNGARAIPQIIRKIRKEYPQLNFIADDFVLLELITKSSEDLLKDINHVISMFPQEYNDMVVAPRPGGLKNTIKDGWNKLFHKKPISESGTRERTEEQEEQEKQTDELDEMVFNDPDDPNNRH